MRERLLNHQQKPRPFGMRAGRLNAVTRILMALLAMMLFPQGTWAGDVVYYKYNGTGFVEETASTYTDLSTVTQSLWNDETLIVSSNTNFSDRIEVYGEVNLILCDGATLTAEKGINVNSDAILNIYGQEKGTGELTAEGYTYDSSNGNGTGVFCGAAIGASYNTNPSISVIPSCGQIYIHGGQITANSSNVDDAAGIGGCGSQGATGLTIYGGKVVATGGMYGAGIGGGGFHGSDYGTFSVSSDGGTVAIYGGEVVASGGAGDEGAQPSMGIGRGSMAYGVNSGPSNGGLTLGSGVACYAGTSANPTTQFADGTRYRYMRTLRSYDLWIGGMQVTESNASDILGSASATPTVSYSPASNTLTLNDAGTVGEIATTMSDLTIHVVGNSMIMGTSNCIRSSAAMPGTLTFTKASGGKLELNNASSGATVIRGFSALAGVPLQTAAPYEMYLNEYYRLKKSLASDTSAVDYALVNADTTYPLWVAGQQVTSESAASVLDTEDGEGNPTVSFTSNVLTLRNATGTAYIDGDIISNMDDLTINLIGTSTITHPAAASGVPASPIYSMNSGTLTLQTTDGTGDLVFSGTYTDPISGFTTVTYQNNLALNTAKDEINVNYDLLVNGIRVTSANAGNVLNSTNTNGDPTVKFDAANNVLTLDGLQTNFGNPIQSGLASLTIEFEGDNTLYSSTKGYIESTNASAVLTFKGISSGTTPSTLTLNNSVGTSAVQGFANVVYNGAYLTANNACSYKTTSASYRDVKNGIVQSVTITTKKHYPLWVYSTQVTDDHKSDVLEDDVPTVTFNETNNTLTLNGASISNSNAIESFLDNLTISLKGDNSVSTYTYGYSAISSGVETASLTITKAATATGNVSLLVQSDLGSSTPSSAIKGFSSISYTGFTPFSYDSDAGAPVDDISSTISYTSTDKALKLSGSDLSAVYFLLPTNLESTGYSYSMVSTTYKGSAVVVPTSVTMTETATTTQTPLTQGEDYTITGYKDANGTVLTGGAPTDVGSYYATISGMSRYTGSVDVPFTITGADISGATIAAIADQVYTGSAITPTPTVTFGGNTLTAGTDFDYSYTNNTDVALSTDNVPPTVTITGKGNFLTTSTKSQTFTIGQADISGAVIAAIADQVYTGSAITPTPTVTFGGKTLTAGTDFDYSYTNNIDVALSTATSAPTVTITGKGNFLTTSTKSQTFTIGQADISTAVIAAISDQVYTGSAITPTPAVTWGGKTLTAGTDFDYSYANNTNAAQSTDAAAPTVTITGKGNFLTTSTKSQTFTIAQANISGAVIAAIADQVYTGSAITPTPTVTFGGKTLTAGTDFEYSYTNNTDVALSTATSAPTVTITGKGNFLTTSTKSQTFTIGQADISTAVIAAIADQTYTGSAITPTPTVTFGGKTLTAGTDFEYSYTNNTDVALSTDAAAPTVTITGKGNFLTTSTKSQTFTIGQADISTAVITAIANQTYTGSAITPTPAVTFGGKALTAGTDFDYSYANNTNAAQSTDAAAPTVTITGKGNFLTTSTKSQTFTIAQADISGATIAAIADQTYTGSAITPTPAVTWGGKTLIAGTDFDYSYTNNTDAAQSTDAAAPTVTITGKGNFLTTSTKSQTFTIVDRVASVTFGARTFKTFYDANESFRVPDNVTAYVVTGVSGNTVTLRRVYYIQAKNAVLMESTPGVTTAVNLSETYGDNYLKGVTATAGVNAAEKHYILYNNEFVRATGTIPDGKVYLDLSTYVRPARTLVITRGNTTAIDDLPSEATDGEDKWHDMQGRKINKPTKAGLYIRNGKKVVIKNK